MKYKSLALNAFLNSIRNILGILFPIITFPYISRRLSVEGIGIYNFSNSIVSYFVLIAALGISTYAIREGAKYRDNKEKITQFSSEVFTINVFSTLIAYLLLFGCLVIFPKLHNYVVCILIFSLQIFFATIGTEWIYQIYEDYTYITIRSIVFQIISIILLFIFVKNPTDYLNYAAITVFSAVGSNIFNFMHARQYCHIHLVFHFNWKKHIIPILTLFAVSIASVIYINSDVTLLGIMKNNYVVGVYSVSSKIYQMVKTLISALLIVTVPRLAMLFGKKQFKEYKIILSKVTNSLVVLTLPASVGLFMLAKEVVIIISGERFLRSVTSLRILTFAYIFSLLAYILSDCVLIPAKREKYILRNTFISAVLNVAFNIICIPFFAENAAAVSTILAEICIFVTNYFSASDLIQDVFKTRTFMWNFISSVIGCFGIVLVCIFSDVEYSSLILKTVLSIVLSVIIYPVILILLKNKVALNVVKNIRYIFSKRS